MSAVEIWRPVPRYEGLYSVSNLGRVRSEDRVMAGPKGRQWTKPGRVLKTPTNQYGYPEVGLCSGSRRSHRTRLVHHLVLEAFVGPRPDGLMCCHGDGDPGNARLSNLRWDTQQSNADDAVAHGAIPRGEHGPGAKLTADQVLSIRADARTQAEIARTYGITASNVSRIKSRDVWAHL